MPQKKRGHAAEQKKMPVGRPFARGQSGNPGGRPKELAEVKRLAQLHAPYAIQRLRELAERADKDSVSVAACQALLDRGFGKPAQSVDVTETRGSLQIIFASERGYDPLAAKSALSQAKAKAIAAEVPDPEVEALDAELIDLEEKPR